MDINSNKYTFGFAAVMVIVVASLLAFASESLKPYQKMNIRHEKMQNILSSVGIDVERHKSEEAFNKYVTKQIVIDAEGNELSAEQLNGLTAFDIDVVKEYRNIKDITKRHYPLFEITKEDGKKYYVVPMAGTGLWDLIWGYVSFESDMNTVAGTKFDHKGETPGLGAEITKPFFQNAFVGKKILDESGNFKGISVIKGGTSPDNPHGINAISGATLTSVGVDEMINRTLKVYVPYFKKMSQKES